MTEALPRAPELAGVGLEFGRLRAFGLRMRVLWVKDRLTRELARGASSTDSRELALRAGQITAKSTREMVAGSIEDLLEQMNRPRPALTAQIPVARVKLSASRDLLGELATRLRSDEPVRAQGMAAVLLLLTDPERPLFGLGGERELKQAIIEATARLEGPPAEGRQS